MINVIILPPRTIEGQDEYNVNIPVLPLIGSHLSSETNDFNGYVTNIDIWQDDKAAWNIIIRIK